MVAEVAGEIRGGLLFEHGDLAVDVIDQVAQGLDPHPVGIAEVHLVQEALAPTPNRSLMGTVTPSLAKTAWIWDFRLVRRWTSLPR